MCIDSTPERCQISRMNPEITNLADAGRRAAAMQDWRTVQECARGILNRARDDADGHFLLGLAEKAARHPRRAIDAFTKVLAMDPSRYDAAVELASQYSLGRRNAEASALLGKFEDKLVNSPLYLDMAGTVYTEIGLPQKAWPLYQRACDLQPEIPLFRANLASCAVYVGEIEAARQAFRYLLDKNPTHQRNHYQLARLQRATDRRHVEQMEQVLRDSNLPAERNIFLYFALGKEYEDLEDWDTAFEWYRKGGEAVMTVADYDIQTDLSVIDAVIENCSADWLARTSTVPPPPEQPLFIVGLPRTGTTLAERIVASHSQVQSVGETEFIQMTLRRESNVESVERMTPEMIAAVAAKDASILSHGYVDTLRYRLTAEPIFVDKLPFNVLYLGFIARAWPDRPIVMMSRHPMDACFAMYKQVFTWAYKFSYDLDNLANYYIGYRKLVDHWRALLGERLVEVNYEDLVHDQEGQTRRLLDRVGLDFEEACLNFDRNAAPTTTASSVQVREKVHTSSVGKWRRFERQLAPLAEKLRGAGIAID